MEKAGEVGGGWRGLRVVGVKEGQVRPLQVTTDALVKG